MWLTLGLKLLGIGKFLRDFFLQNWKWLVPLLLVIAGFLWTKEHYYNAGQSDEKAAWEEKIRIETEKNIRLTETIANAVNTFGTAVQKLDEVRIERETTHENRIDTIIQEKPVYTECKVDQEVLNEQNAIKALGPKP